MWGAQSVTWVKKREACRQRAEETGSVGGERERKFDWDHGLGGLSEEEG